MAAPGRWWIAFPLAVVVVLSGLLPQSPAGAQDGTGADGGLIDDIGPGWAAGQLCSLMQQTATEPMACFERDGDELTIKSVEVGTGVDQRSFAALAAKAFSTYPSLPTPDLDAAHGFIASTERGSTALTIVIAGTRHVYTLIYTSSRPFAEAAPFAIDVARQQQEYDGGPPPASPPSAGSRNDAALDGLLMDVPPGSGFVIIDTASLPQTFDDLRPTSRSQRVVDLLNDAPTRHRVFQAGPASFVVVTLTQQPFSQFAATQLGAFRDVVGTTHRRKARLVDDAVGFRFEDSPAYGVVFRRGAYIATVAVVAPAAGPLDDPALERSVDELAQIQASLLPSGGTAPYFFPSTTRSIVFTLLFATATCLIAVGFPHLAASRRRRKVRTIRQDFDDVAFFGDAVDVERAAAVLRRQGLFLLGGQVVAVDLVVVGVLSALGVLELPRWLGPALLAAGLAGGVLLTSWRARAELKANGVGGAPVKGLWRSPLSVAGALVAVSLLVVAMAFAAVGLAGLAFGPSLSVLERSKTLGLGPDTISLLTALSGLVLLVLGALSVRLARIWARTSATRQRRRDRRPPILYLRSFYDDALPLPAVLTARRPFLELFLPRGSDPFEESVAWELAPYGPVVAIGQPGRPLSSLGAARDRLSAEEWQLGVAARMAEARAVVMVIGATDGVRWELGHIVAAGRLTRTIFVFPPVPADALRDRWRFSTEVLSWAGVTVAPLPAASARVLTAVVDERRQWHAAVADRRDEASYRVAVDQAMLWVQRDAAEARAAAAEPD
jgi:hypothetical protein